MKYSTFLFVILILLVSSCSTKNTRKQSVFTAANLKSIFITLNADSAYILKSPKGAIIKIAKNSFDLKGNPNVQLEIKEAYTPQDILLAGLTTESNGKPLSSGGMIYINATANDAEVKLLKPISISIPGKVYDDKMQLFTGELNADSTINWVDPRPMDSSSVAKKLALGEQLFKANCASCHKPTQEFTGPALALSRERAPDPDWPYRFTRNPAVMEDAYARAIKNKWSPVIMTSFPLLSRYDVDAILDYCDNEALLNSWPEKLPAVNTSQVKADSTGKIDKPCSTTDTIYMTSPVNINTIQIISNDILPDAPVNKIETRKPEEVEGLRRGFTDTPISGMYEFSIETFGWYNIDAFVEGYAGTTNVKVEANLQMEYKMELHVYLFCPNKKMLSVSNNTKDGVFSFDKIDGKIPLFLNDRAILLAFGSHEGKTFYGTAAFNVQSEQKMNIKIKETSLADLKSFVELNKIDGIKIDATKKEMIYQPGLPATEKTPVEIDIIEVPCNRDTSKNVNTIPSVFK